MELYFSQSTQGFYPGEMMVAYKSATAWPDDAVQVSPEKEKMMRKAISSGKRVVIDNAGVSFVDIEKSIDDIAREARALRDDLLRSCDYMMLPDYPLSDTDAEDLRKYRQLLRDVPSQQLFPYTINWPTAPIFVK